MTVDPETVKQDAERLQQNLNQTKSDLDAAWRKLAMEANPRRRAQLEQRVTDLTYQARALATAHERAVKALKKR